MTDADIAPKIQKELEMNKVENRYWDEILEKEEYYKYEKKLMQKKDWERKWKERQGDTKVSGKMFTTTSTGELLIQRPLRSEILPTMSQDIVYNMKRKKENFRRIWNPSEPQKANPIDKDASKKESTFIPNRLNREKKNLD